jgi:hypothetical protein
MRIRQYKDSARLVAIGIVGVISTIIIYLAIYYFR